jgi:DNA-binding GntR family transcriptional regulator
LVTAAGRTRGLPDEVATYVRELILSGQVRPGDFLRLEPIAEAVGVSNTPVREGLLALSSEGFVRLVPRRGFMVESFTIEDVTDIFWAQAKFAGELAARAAKRISEDEIDDLERINKDYAASVDSGDLERVGALGHEFHRRLNQAAHSQRLALILSSIVQHLPNRFYAEIEGHVEATRDDHDKIITALRKRDGRTARKLTEEHILESTSHLIDLLRSRGLWDEEKTA